MTATGNSTGDEASGSTASWRVSDASRDGSIDSTSDNNTALQTARRKFMPGPAAATSAMSRRGRLMFRGSTGTGFAHPNRKLPGSIKQINGTMMVPKRSICGRGFMVRRPCLRGRIAAFIGDPPMGILMQDHGKEQRQRFVREGEQQLGKIVHGRQSSCVKRPRLT